MKIFFIIYLLLMSCSLAISQTVMQTEANPPGVSNLTGGIYSGFAIVGEPAVGEITAVSISDQIGTLYRLSNNSIVTLNSISSITETSASSSYTVSDDMTSVISRGLVWNTITAPTIALVTKTNDGTSLGTFNTVVSTLSPGTHYYFRAYSNSIEGVVYSNEISFWTLSTKPSAHSNLFTVNVIDDNNVTLNFQAASQIGNCSGYIILKKQSNLAPDATGVTNATLPNNLSLPVGTSLFAVISNINQTSINDATILPRIDYQYAIIPYNSNADNEGSYQYRTNATIPTLRVITGVPLMTLGSLQNLSINSFDIVNNDAYSIAEFPITSKGICYNTTGNPTTANSTVLAGSGNGFFNATFSSLLSSNTYYFKAFGINSFGTGYSSQNLATTLPNVSTNSLTVISNTQVDVNSTVVNEGNASLTAKGIIWSITNSTPTLSDYLDMLNSSTAKGNYTLSMIALIPSTHYYTRAYSTNAGGTSYGSVLNFYTPANVPLAPTLSNITTSTIDVTINTNGNPSSTEYAIQEANSSTFVQVGGGLGASEVWQTNAVWATKTVNGLSPNMPYTFKVKARNGNNIETILSNPSSNYTKANLPVTPTLNNANPSTLDITLNIDGNPANTEYAIQETSSGNYVHLDGTLSAGEIWQNKVNWGTKTVSSLMLNTQYTFRVKARNGDWVETLFSGTASLYTSANVPSAPTINGATTSSLNLLINTNSNPANVEFAIQEIGSGNYVQSDGSLSILPIWKTETLWEVNAGNSAKTIIGLSPYTLYQFSVKARNASLVETVLSSSNSLETLPNAPSVNNASNFSSNGFRANWTAPIGGAASYKIEVASNIGFAPVLQSTSGIIPIYLDVASLNPETQYFYKVRGTSSGGDGAYSGIQSLYTTSIVPSAHPASFTSLVLTTTSIRLFFSAANTIGNCDGYIILRRTDNYPDATGVSNGTSPGSLSLPIGTSLITTITNTSTTSFDNSGLTIGSTYYYSIIPFNWDMSHNETYNYRTQATILTTFQQTITIPTLTTTAISSITPYTCYSGGNISADGGASVTYRGVVWSTAATPTLTINENGHTSDGIDIGVFVSYMTNLLPNTTYYVRAYATNSVGTAYGGEISFTTMEAIQAKKIVFTNIQQYQLSFAWTNGNGVGRVVLCKEDAVINPNPLTNNTTYNASFFFRQGTKVDNGYIVYKGTGNSVTTKSLSRGHLYFFKVFEYYNPVGTEVYNQVNAEYNPHYKATLRKEINESNIFENNTKALSVFPNPSSEKVTLNLNFEDSKSIEVTVFDLNGNIVMRPYFAYPIANGNSQLAMDIKDLPTGTYQVLVNTGDEVVFEIFNVVR